MASATLDATIQALQSGPKAIPVSAAILNIDTWVKELGSSSDADVKAIAGDLQRLKILLQTPSANNTAITTLLQKLGKSTIAAAGSNKKLQELGTLLAG